MSGASSGEGKRVLKMLDTDKTRAEMMKHLEAAMLLAGELGEPTTEYLIERAIDEARGEAWGLKPFEKP
jgi:hypothetical protein